LLDGVDGLGNQVGAELDRSQRGSPECLPEGFGLRHFLYGGDGIELVKAQFGEFDAIKRKLSIWRVDVEDAHDAVAAHDRLHRVVGAGRGFTEIFFYKLGFWQL
jgi:hypothetical protein